MLSKRGLFLLPCFIFMIGQSSTNKTPVQVPSSKKEPSTPTVPSSKKEPTTTVPPSAKNLSTTTIPLPTKENSTITVPSTATPTLTTDKTQITKTSTSGNATKSSLNVTSRVSETITSITTRANAPLTSTNTKLPSSTTSLKSTSASTSLNYSSESSKSHISPTTGSATHSLPASVNGSSPGITKLTGTLPSAASLPPQVALRYPTVAFNTDNDTCPFGYIPEMSINACKHVCENKECQNGGQCYAEVDVDNGTVALCRCQETSNKIYKGDTCDISKLSRHRERAITLGILLPFDVLFILIIIAMCYKLKHRGNQFHAAQKSYDVNNL